MITKILAALSLAAIPLHSLAHDEYSTGSTEIEFYEIEVSPNEKLKLSHLKIHAENEFHGDEREADNPLPPPTQNFTNERQAFSLTPL
ncbi:hypothetical protein [Pseudomonas fluorescens]|uniref:hypothetical protein n=1 Tax=Pseudomonas fluorescens TaxID=294 RepID=UPI0009BB3AB7|nr:hypothetical protein [Pseudomonas fluorescens]